LETRDFRVRVFLSGVQSRRCMFGRRALSVSGPAACNSLPDYLRDPSRSADSFAATWKLCFSHFTSVHSALEALRLCAISTLHYWHWHWHSAAETLVRRAGNINCHQLISMRSQRRPCYKLMSTSVDSRPGYSALHRCRFSTHSVQKRIKNILLGLNYCNFVVRPKILTTFTAYIVWLESCYPLYIRYKFR